MYHQAVASIVGPQHGTVTDIFDNPQRPYTMSLLESIPSGIARVAGVPQMRRPRIVNEEKTA